MSTTSSNTLNRDAVESFTRVANIQLDGSYKEQKLAIQTCIKAIDDYRNVNRKGTFVKHVSIRGIPGAGRTWY